MKALQIQIKEGNRQPHISLVTLPSPQVAPGYALVKIQYSSIQPSDKLNAKGGFPATSFPRIPGRDFAGEVVDATAATAHWIGKQVYGTSDSQFGFSIDGAHSQFALVPEGMLVERPATLTPLQAASVGVPFTTALMCLTRARACSVDTVLVLGGTGQVGSAAIQIARALGCSVLSASRSGKPDVTLSSHTEPIGLKATVAQQVADLTNGRGVDIIVDTVGDTDLMRLSLPALAQKGRYTWIAAPRDGRPTTVTFDIFQAYRKEIELIGCNSAHSDAATVAEELTILKDMFDKDKITGPDEADIMLITLDEAIDRGYKAEKSNKRHTVIRME